MSIWVEIQNLTNPEFDRNFRKSRYFFEIFENPEFCFWVQIFGKSRFGGKIFENGHCDKKFSENLHSCHNFWKYWYFVKTVGNLDIGQNFIGKSSLFIFFSKVSILFKIYQILDFGQNFQNADFYHNFRKKKPSFLVKVFENVGFAKKNLKSQQWSKVSKNLDFSHNFWKSLFLSKFSEIISGFVKNFDNFIFGPNFR